MGFNGAYSHLTSKTEWRGIEEVKRRRVGKAKKGAKAKKEEERGRRTPLLRTR